MTKVFLIGVDDDMVERVQQELRKMGRDDIQVASGLPTEGDLHGEHGPVGCGECVMCKLAEEAFREGRNPLVHPSIQHENGHLKGKVRYRLFLDPMGNKFFFEDLFHPVDELNLYTVECEVVAQERYDCTGIVQDGEAVYHEVDYSQGQPPLTHITGQVTYDGVPVDIVCIAGPMFDKAIAMRAARAH